MLPCRLPRAPGVPRELPRHDGRAADAQIYRSIPVGPSVEVFALDMRSYRSANNENLQSAAGADTNLLGTRQVRWLADALTRSKAAWKIVAADMPLDRRGAPARACA